MTDAIRNALTKAQQGMVVAVLAIYLAAVVTLGITRLLLEWSADGQALASISVVMLMLVLIWRAGLWKGTRRTGGRAAGNFVILLSVVLVTNMLRASSVLGPSDWVVIAVLLVLPAFLLGQIALDWRSG